MDGDSGILDNSRDVKRRIKAFAYAYRLTNDTKWPERAWVELQVSLLMFMLFLHLADVKLECRREWHYPVRPPRSRQMES